jgi:hypothetical protein
LPPFGQPTFVANGDGDSMIPPRLSHPLGCLIPNAEVQIYPEEAGHGLPVSAQQEILVPT